MSRLVHPREYRKGGCRLDSPEVGTHAYPIRADFVDSIAVGWWAGVPQEPELDSCLLASGRPPSAGISPLMPNIRQQEKRVRIAARQRLENLRYRSSVKTLTKRLENAVADGDAEAVAAEHLQLVRTIDKAASHGALHKNTAARKKAQAARIAAGTGS